jgi:hypothetical protein
MMNGALLLAALLTTAFAPSPDLSVCGIEDRWLMDERMWEIRIEAAEDRWRGTVEAARDEDVEPGSEIFTDLVFEPEKNRYSGTMIRPDSGREVPIEIACVDDDTLEVRARVLFVRRSFQLRRIARS